MEQVGEAVMEMKDGLYSIFTVANKGMDIQVDTYDLVLCRHCIRHETPRCPLWMTPCFVPVDNFFCAFGEVRKNETVE